MEQTALVYVRKSVVKANKPTLSPQRQEESCREFCEQKGWRVEVYADAEGHRSGRSEKTRPEWLLLKDRLERSTPGEIAAVVVYVLDRSSRSTRDFLNFLHLLQQKGVEFVSVTQQFLDTTSATGRAFMTMISIWAQLEADMDSERVIQDSAYRQEQGLHVGNCPIGYGRQLVNGERIPVPDDTAEKVVLIWEQYATGNYSYRSLARWINNILQLQTKSGGLWTHRHVQIMFDNWLFYTGWVTRYRKKGGQEKFRGKHAAIITEELAQTVLRVRAEKEDTKLRNRRPAKEAYLLVPLVHCAECGQQLRGHISHGQRCYQHNGKSSCSFSLVHADRLEAQVLKLFAGWEISPALEAVIQRELAAQAARQATSAQDQAKLDQLQKRKERAMRLFELGMKDEVWLIATTREIDEAMAKLKPAAPLGYNVGHLAQMLRGFGQIIQDPDTPPELLRKMLFGIIERIETNGEVATRVVPRRWFAQFFTDCANLYPQGNSNPCRHLERVVS